MWFYGGKNVYAFWFLIIFILSMLVISVKTSVQQNNSCFYFQLHCWKFKNFLTGKTEKFIKFWSLINYSLILIKKKSWLFTIFNSNYSKQYMSCDTTPVQTQSLKTHKFIKWEKPSSHKKIKTNRVIRLKKREKKM